MKTKLVYNLLFLLLTTTIYSQNPHFEWAKKMGGVSYESGLAIATDKNNNVYTTGYYMSNTDFDPNTGVFNLYCSGDEDIFIQKLDKNGNFIWAKKIGNQYGQIAWAIDVDTNNNVYIAGEFGGTVDFNPSADTAYLTSSVMHDAFILKLDSNGNYIWAKQLSGTSKKIISSIKIDHYGNIIVTGYFSGNVDFDPSSTINNIYSNYGSKDIFILKLDTNANLLWVKTIGGTSQDYGKSIAIDNNDNIYVTGMFSGTVDFNTGAPILNYTSYGSSDIFVLKLNSNGIYQWSKHMGGSGNDRGSAIVCDDYGNVYTTGSFFNTVDFNPNTATSTLTSTGYSDIYIQKLSPNGIFKWVRQISNIHYDYGKAIAIDNFQNLYITGQYKSGDTFISKLDSAGNSIYLSSNHNGYSNGTGICIDNENNILITGIFSGFHDFNLSSSSYYLSSNGNWDIFVAKHSQCIATSSTDSIVACGSYTWLDSITYTASNNSATYTITNTNGCDSIIRLNLTINNPSIAIDSIIACDSFTWTNGITYSTSNNTANYILTNANGCDSLRSLKLVINPSYIIIDSINACNQFTWIDGNTYYSSNITASYPLISTMGCDSTHLLHLTIDSVSDLSLSITGATVTANNANGTFQWLNCNNNYSIIMGAINSSFSPMINGNYAVEITENSCIDTSACVQINNVSIYKQNRNIVKLFPNPNKGEFNIDYGELNVESITINDLQGKIIYKSFKPLLAPIHLLLDIEQGIYILKLNTSQDVYIYKIIIQDK